MGKNATVNVRTPEDIKRRAEEVFRQLGLTMSSAINLFLHHVANRREVPLDLKPDYICPHCGKSEHILNSETAAALESGEYEETESVEELFDEVVAE